MDKPFKPGSFPPLTIQPYVTASIKRGRLVLLAGDSEFEMDNDAIELLKRYLADYSAEMEKFYTGRTLSPKLVQPK